MEKMILPLNDLIKKQFADSRLNQLVKALALLAAEYAMTSFRKPLYISSIYRPGDDGVHGIWRGVDADNDSLTKSQKREIAEHINEHFIYDPERPDMVVCLLHTAPGRGGDHFHLQVHPRTTLTGGG